MKLRDKIILVTGGSKGIGKGISRTFLENGASVIINARDSGQLENAVDELSEYGDVYSIQGDLANINDIRKIAGFLDKKFGYLNVLVNNAGILGKRVLIEDYPEDIWDRVIDINLNAQFYITKAMIPYLKKSKNGSSVINVSSSVGRSGRAYWGAYSVSKFGIEALTQILAQELESSGVRVNSVNPGGTRTDMRASAYPEEDPDTLPSPEQISSVFLYLASDESNETGQQFNAREWL